MAKQTPPQDEQTDSSELKSTGYELFILLLSLVSVFNMVVELSGRFVGIAATTLGVIHIVNAILTVFFLFDFFYRLFTASSMPGYFWGGQGWADLLACAPQLRIFRLFRVVRAIRLLRRFGIRNMLNEIVHNRASSALYITVFLIIVVAETAAATILLAESANPDANLTTAGDAVWWVFVTLTTVGYGDFFPITGTGRIIAVFVMFSGTALIGVLASFLASFFLGTPAEPDEEALAPDDPKAKLAEMRTMLEEQEKSSAALREKLAEMEKLL